MNLTSATITIVLKHMCILYPGESSCKCARKIFSFFKTPCQFPAHNVNPFLVVLECSDAEQPDGNVTNQQSCFSTSNQYVRSMH